MSGNFLITALTSISVLTTLTVEALKKLLGDRKYSSNILAAVTAVAITLAVSIGYLIYTGTAVNPQIVVTIIALMFLSFLGSTIGFDKIKQMIEQVS